MAEILGTVSSLLQLLDTALKAREYVQDFRHAVQEKKRLLSEMGDLRTLLEELRNRITANSTSSVLQQTKGPLAALKSAMELFTEDLRPGGGPLTAFTRRLKWTMWNKKEAAEHLTRFEQFKSQLHLWLSLEIQDMGERHHTAVVRSIDKVAAGVDCQERTLTSASNTISEQISRSHCTIIESVDNVACLVREHKRAADSIEIQISSSERTKIIEWLSPINFFLRQADISRSRQPGTGSWLLADPGFRQWKSEVGKTLWCNGIPGAGKTVLASMVVEYLSAEAEDKNIAVACLYLNHKEVDVQTPSNLLAALWRQLVFGKHLTSLAQSLYQQHMEKGTNPSLDEIHELLSSAIAEYDKVFIVVDAVDEYPERQRQILFEHLAASGPDVNMMIMSRPHVPPGTSLPGTKTLEIHAKAEDIKKYVDAQIRISPRLSKHVHTRPALREEIHSEIGRNVDGMFLLAKLHIESLGRKCTIKAVREALKILPKDLNDTYDSAMKRIEEQNEDDQRIAYSTLMWVANAKRPLKVTELQVALAVEPDTTHLDEDNLADLDVILSVCAGLVIVDDRLSVVRLVHYTAQEYLDGIQPQRFPEAQTEICQSLFSFLAFDHPAFRFTRDIPAESLYEYSQYCLAHSAGRPEGKLLDMILHFLDHASWWRRTTRGLWSSPPWNFPDWPSQPSALWIAAATNLVETAGFLLADAAPPQESNFAVSSAIQVASYYGHLQMVQLLIENGADVNAHDGRFHSALQAASLMGHKALVQLLLENGANVNSCGGRYGNPLQAASFSGHEDIARLLIDNHADVNARGGAFKNVLRAASTMKHENIVRLLIANGADVNGHGEPNDSPLQAASFQGTEKVARLLINSGADVNAHGGYYHSILQAASFMGYENIVRLLVDNGANVNDRGGDHHSSLQAASSRGYYDIVRILIERGADVNAQGGRYGSALHRAASMGYDRVVWLLLQNGASINVQSVLQGSPLPTPLSALPQHQLRRLLKEDTEDRDADRPISGMHTPGTDGPEVNEGNNTHSIGSQDGEIPAAMTKLENGSLADSRAHQATEGKKVIEWFLPIDFSLQPGTGSWLLPVSDIRQWESEAGRTPWWNGSLGADETVLHASGNIAVVHVPWIHKEVDVHTLSYLLAAPEGNSFLGRICQWLALAGFYQHHMEKRITPSLDDIHELERCKVFVAIRDALDEYYYLESQRQSFFEQLIFLGNLTAPEPRRNGIRGAISMLDHTDFEWSLRDGAYSEEFQDLALQAACYSAQLSVVLQQLLKYGENVSPQNGQYWRAMQAAASVGRPSVVRLLIEHGADINASGGKYGSPLGAASWHGHQDVVALLIENGADVNAHNEPRGRTPLQMASSRGHRTIVEALIKHGAEVNSQGGKDGGALTAASTGGHEEIVALLVQNGADVNAEGGRYHSALEAAVSAGYEGIVQLLLESGANPDLGGGPFYISLPEASHRGFEQIVQILLKNGAEVNAEGGHYHSALLAAVCAGQEGIVQLLLQKGADPNLHGGHYSSPLQEASFRGSAQIVRILLKNGAEVNAEGGHYHSALRAAMCAGQEGIVQLLLQKGADPNLHGGHYSSPLQEASFRGSAQIVQILLENGADVNAEGGKYHNALRAAVCAGQEGIVQLLLQKHADPNLRGGHYSSPLQEASFRGFERIVQILLDSGADINVTSGTHRHCSPLEAAATQGHETIVWLLIGHGADLSKESGAALCAASFHGWADLVDLFIKNGADVNPSTEGGRIESPLQAALSKGRLEIAKMLIENGAQ